ncbi:hypothetical protein [Ectopseudomonas oleovorans]|uniref:hypothetical protein n=1 Tax=Ectopseudomonas oleovorans TaxID=301 RepID=UPI003F197CCD
MPFKQQEQILFYLVDRLPNFMAGAHDARGNGQALAEAAAVRYGHTRISQVMLTEGWYRDNMPGLKADLEDGTLYDLPADRDVIADLRSLKMIKGVARIPEGRSTDKSGNKRHGDAAIAIALARFASRMDIEQYGYEAVRSSTLIIDDDDTFSGGRNVGGVW